MRKATDSPSSVTENVEREDLLQETPDGLPGVSLFYIRTLERWRKDLDAAFTEKENRHASYPSEDVLDGLRGYRKLPKLSQDIILELSDMILDSEENDGELLGKIAHPHQLGHLKWLVLSLMEGGSSFLIEGGPGSGKTLVLGALMRACTRLQMKGLLDGVVAFATHKEYILNQQVFNPDDRRRYLEQELRAWDLQDDADFMQKFLGNSCTECIPRAEWEKLRRASIRGKDNAVLKLQELVLKNNGQDFWEKNKEVMYQLAAILCGEGVLVYDIDELPMFLPLSSPPENPADISYSGDLGKGIPNEYLKENRVAARKGADIDNALDAITNETADDVRVLLTTASTILQKKHHGAIRGILPRVKVVLVDEGNTACSNFQASIEQGIDTVTAEVREPVLVFMASALSTTNGIDSRPQADKYSPRKTIAECMEPGADGRQVSPDMGADVYPYIGDTLYPVGTTEAFHQMMEHHFEEFPLNTELDQPQPSECTTVMAVNGPDIVPATEYLREEYKEEDIPAIIVPFRMNKERRTSSGNTRHPYSARVFQWLNDKGLDDKHVKILVGTTLDLRDALSIQTLRHVSIGTKITQNNLLRLASRLQHADHHLKEGGERYRGMVSQQIFQGSDPKNNIFSLLGHADGKPHPSHIPMAVVRGSRGAALDAADADGIKEVSSPETKKDLKKLTKVEGHVPPRILTNQHAILYDWQLDIAAAEHDPVWNDLELIALRAVRNWQDVYVQQTFQSILLERIMPVRPQVMRENWTAWQETLCILMRDQDNPQDMLNVVRRRFISAAKLGLETNRSPLVIHTQLGGMIGENEDAEPEYEQLAEESTDEPDDEIEEPSPDALLEIESEFPVEKSKKKRKRQASGGYQWTSPHS